VGASCYSLLVSLRPHCLSGHLQGDSHYILVPLLKATAASPLHLEPRARLGYFCPCHLDSICSTVGESGPTELEPSPCVFQAPRDSGWESMGSGKPHPFQPGRDSVPLQPFKLSLVRVSGASVPTKKNPQRGPFHAGASS
jgi:hypothetical protein